MWRITRRPIWIFGNLNTAMRSHSLRCEQTLLWGSIMHLAKRPLISICTAANRTIFGRSLLIGLEATKWEGSHSFGHDRPSDGVIMNLKVPKDLITVLIGPYGTRMWRNGMGMSSGSLVCQGRGMVSRICRIVKLLVHSK